jgi:glutathione S-transferase
MGYRMPYYTAIATLLAVALYFVLATQVAAARGKFNVKLPATTGDPHFERIFRAHINILEWMPTFLAPLWLCAIYLNDAAAAALGLIWIGGRIWYFFGLPPRSGEALAGVLHPVERMPATVCRRGRWDPNAPMRWLIAGLCNRIR